jgi:hypothetical protein
MQEPVENAAAASWPTTRGKEAACQWPAREVQPALVLLHIDIPLPPGSHNVNFGLRAAHEGITAASFNQTGGFRLRHPAGSQPEIARPRAP